MQQFLQIYSQILYRPFIKFNLNLFKLTHTLTFNYKFLLSPYFFLPTKTLRVKILQNNIFTLYFKIYTYLVAGSLFLAIFFFVV